MPDPNIYFSTGDIILRLAEQIRLSFLSAASRRARRVVSVEVFDEGALRIRYPPCGCVPYDPPLKLFYKVFDLTEYY